MPCRVEAGNGPRQVRYRETVCLSRARRTKRTENLFVWQRGSHRQDSAHVLTMTFDPNGSVLVNLLRVHHVKGLSAYAASPNLGTILNSTRAAADSLRKGCGRKIGYVHLRKLGGGIASSTKRSQNMGWFTVPYRVVLTAQAISGAGLLLYGRPPMNL